jgi:hypothetical protein
MPPKRYGERLGSIDGLYVVMFPISLSSRLERLLHFL